MAFVVGPKVTPEKNKVSNGVGGCTKLQFFVSAYCRAEEGVFIVGSLPEIGSWSVSNAKLLSLLDNIDAKHQRWGIKLSVTTTELQQFQYRYFIGAQLRDSAGNHRIIVRYVEQALPRMILPSSTNRSADGALLIEDQFGYVCPLLNTSHASAVAAPANCRVRVRRGVLHCECEIHVRMYHDSFTFLPSDFLHDAAVDATDVNCKLLCRLGGAANTSHKQHQYQQQRSVTPTPGVATPRSSIIEAYRFCQSEGDEENLLKKTPRYLAQNAVGPLSLSKLNERKDFIFYRIATVDWHKVELEVQLLDSKNRILGYAAVLPQQQMSDMCGCVRVPVLTSTELQQQYRTRNPSGRSAENGVDSWFSLSDAFNKQDEESSAIPPVIGYLKIDYSIIQPFIPNIVTPEPLGREVNGFTLAAVTVPCSFQPDNLEHLFVGYFSRPQIPLKIGHRGSGTSFGKPNRTQTKANVRENTIASFTAALDKGADMIEFDVQLSRDRMPVIYHDFYCRVKPEILPEATATTTNDTTNGSEQPTTTAAVKTNIENTLEVQCHQLSYYQMTHWKIYHSTESHGHTPFDITERVGLEYRPFPTLKFALENVPEKLGFDVELKYPQALVDGSMEATSFPERNWYVDAILRVLLNFASTKRRIIISCFDADVAAMLRAKQCVFPVVYLTDVFRNQQADFGDRRTKFIDNNFRIAKLYDLFGLAMHTDNALDEPGGIVDVVKMAKIMGGMMLFCWGSDNQDHTVIERLLKTGIDGVIYDRANELDVTDVFNKLRRHSILEGNHVEDEEDCDKILGPIASRKQ